MGAKGAGLRRTAKTRSMEFNLELLECGYLRIIEIVDVKYLMVRLAATRMDATDVTVKCDCVFLMHEERQLLLVDGRVLQLVAGKAKTLRRAVFEMEMLGPIRRRGERWPTD
jgi:hypothetical protein